MFGKIYETRQSHQEVLWCGKLKHKYFYIFVLETNASALKLILTKMTLFRLDVDARNRMGYTALLLACKQGNYQSALALVRMGNACPHLRDGEFKYNAKDWLLR